jgi:hypothetical protein
MMYSHPDAIDSLQIVSKTNNTQGWSKSRGKLRRLIGILSQNPGQSCAVWANPVGMNHLQVEVAIPQSRHLLRPDGATGREVIFL